MSDEMMQKSNSREGSQSNCCSQAEGKGRGNELRVHNEVGAVCYNTAYC